MTGAGTSNVAGTGYTNRSTTITSLGNGWYKCTLGFTIPASGVTSVQPKIWIGGYNGTNNAGMNIYAWGAQLEQGLFATSYIPTTTATVTRAADVLTMPTGSWFNAPAGSVFTQADHFGGGAGDVGGVFALNDSSVNNRIDLRAGQVQAVISSAGVSTSLNPISFSGGAAQKVAIEYSASVAAGSRNGASPLTGSPLVPIGISKLWIGNIDGGFYWLNGHVAKFKYYPKAVTTPQLQLLSQ